MKIELPTSALLFMGNSYTNVWEWGDVHGTTLWCPHYNILAYPLSYASIDIMDRLIQVTSGHNTDVCHGKLIDASIPYAENAALEIVKRFQPNAFPPNASDGKLVGIAVPTTVTSSDERGNKQTARWQFVMKDDLTFVARETKTNYNVRTNETYGSCQEYYVGPNPRWGTIDQYVTNPVNLYRLNAPNRRQYFMGDVGPDAVDDLYDAHPEWRRLIRQTLRFVRVDGLELDASKIPLPSKFWYNEPAILDGKALWPDHIRRGFQDAFLNACEQFPKAADNNLSNLKDMLELCKQILVQPFKVVPKSLSQLWLFWRYCLSTSSADTKQALKYTTRRYISGGKPSHYYGRSSVSGTSMGTSDIRVTVGFDVWLNVADMAAMIKYRLNQQGLELTPYTAWDFIPFSFVVDWFVPVGDRLKLNDDIRHIEQDYIFANCVFSIKYTKELEQGTAQYYTRFYSAPPAMDDYTMYDDGATGIATTLKRVVDIPSLVAQKLK